ncbi:MAG TPA: LysM peptidoglycan-binding domain-containing protein [Chlamydiales bacterium]|nr:LysM peptidoglycan-binding domain-containing protein [Chlamydiales bacterium]
MSKRDVIVASALINACLLAGLFVFAITSKEKVLEESSYLAAQHLQAEPIIPTKEVVHMAIDLPEEKIIVEEEIAHVLPPVIEEKIVEKETEILKEHVVKKGDSLDLIAKRNKTTVEKIMQLNQLSTSLLQINQKLKLPEPAEIVAVKETAVQKPQQEEKYYTVKCGDNPWTIAMKHHLRVEELLKLNNLDQKKARRIKPGDKLRIR